MIFRERLNRAQFAALAIAVVAVVVLTVEVGALPIIGLGLALSFGLYGAVKKVVPTDPRVSVGVEAGDRDAACSRVHRGAAAHRRTGRSPTRVPTTSC